MAHIYGVPQPLTGNETVTIQQIQNGQIVECTMPFSTLISFISGGLVSSLTSSLSKTEPSVTGVMWNNNGVVSIS
jgi:hypothetical protein